MNRHPTSTLHLIVLAASLTLAACSDNKAPVTQVTVSPVAISSVVPREARVGDTIIVTGQQFGATQGTSTLSINGVVATQIASWSDTQIEATVPNGATTGNVSVTVNGVAGAPGHLVVMWQATNPVHAPVSTAANDQTDPAQIPDGRGGSIVVWADLRDGSYNVYAQRLNNAGQALWAADGVSLGVAANGSTQGSPPHLVSDGAGGAIVVWSDARNGSVQVYAQRINASGSPQWASGGLRVSGFSPSEVKPRVVSDGTGGAIVAWYDLGGRGATHAQRISSAGVMLWTEGVKLLPLADVGTVNPPAIVADGNGGAIVAAANSFGAGRLGAVQRVDSAGTVLWPADGVVLGDSVYGQNLISDGAGGAISVVLLRPSSFTEVIVAQHVDAAGTKQWGTDGVALRYDNRYIDLAKAPALVSDGAGGAIVAWRWGRTSHAIEAQRINGGGVLQWTFNGTTLVDGVERPNPVVIDGSVSAKSNPQLLDDGNGGAFLVWSDARSGAEDLYGQRLRDTGTLLWADATTISTAPGAQTLPRLVADDQRGAIVVWQDTRSGNKDIYAQRISADGRQ